MESIDLDLLRNWIGREDEARDMVTPGLVERFSATFDGLLADSEFGRLGLHWCLAPAAAPAGELGPDGHPKRGGFLPPVPLPRRMWAGGDLTFLGPLSAGDEVTRRSRITDVSHKAGRTGDLVFVTVEHELSTARGPAIRERQNTVYRGAEAAKTAPAPAERFDVSETIACDSVLLFRYSALTFNGHRIHYDRTYATDAEHYDGLVVHGPLQATCLMNFAARLHPDKRLIKLSYRGVSPLFDGPSFEVRGRDEGDHLRLWTSGPSGVSAITMTAKFS